MNTCVTTFYGTANFHQVHVGLIDTERGQTVNDDSLSTLGINLPYFDLYVDHTQDLYDFKDKKNVSMFLNFSLKSYKDYVTI